MILRGGLTESAQIQTNTESLVFVAGPMPRYDLVSKKYKEKCFLNLSFQQHF